MINYYEVQKMNVETLNNYLSIKDLTDSINGVHAINLLIDRLKNAFESDKSYPSVQIKRSDSISNVTDEFDKLYIPLNNKQRLSRYVRYIDETNLLRSHTTPIIPKVLNEIKSQNLSDTLVFCPGMCYQRTIISKNRTGEPHKMDIWRFKKGKTAFNKDSLINFIQIVLEAISPGAKYRISDTTHPYTTNGLIVEVEVAVDSWLKLFECGLVAPKLLEDAGLDPNEYSGYGAGLGLERCVMHIKKIDDIRVLRSQNPYIKSQMETLDVFKPVQFLQESKHDFSVILPSHFEEEDVSELIRVALGSDKNSVEQVKVVDVFNESKLRSDQKKILFEVIFCPLDKKITENDLNILVNKIYSQIENLQIDKALE